MLSLTRRVSVWANVFAVDPDERRVKNSLFAVDPDKRRVKNTY